jgi:5-methyltetrahydropteroyltriglutamate--homocysteine methyltransferase
MRRSTDRILVSHAGTLPRPEDLAELMAAGPSAAEAFDARVPSAVQEVVRTQVELGIDIVNDG